MYPEDDPQKPRMIRFIRLNREQLMKFVGELHEMQMDMIEEAVSASDMQESKDVIKYIMEKN
jgi:hypothetical protein|tara:strand:+ start:186 stop:371 length:186 start_codon:yes stop_codon:yes gene_type:complete